jgi:TPR repeat protein
MIFSFSQGGDERNADDLYQLGMSYHLGDDTGEREKDLKEALHYYQLSAEQGL